MTVPPVQFLLTFLGCESNNETHLETIPRTTLADPSGIGANRIRNGTGKPQKEPYYPWHSLSTSTHHVFPVTCRARVGALVPCDAQWLTNGEEKPRRVMLSNLFWNRWPIWPYQLKLAPSNEMYKKQSTVRGVSRAISSNRSVAAANPSTHSTGIPKKPLKISSLGTVIMLSEDVTFVSDQVCAQRGQRTLCNHRQNLRLCRFLRDEPAS